MTIPKFGAEDRDQFLAMSEEKRTEVLGNVFSSLIREGDASISIVAALDSSVRDEIIRAYKSWFGDAFLMRGIYFTVAISVGIAIGTVVAGNSWWGALISAVISFFCIGYFVSRRNTKIAITRLAEAYYPHFDYLWKEKVVALRVKHSDQTYDSRHVNRWQDVVLDLVGWSDLQTERTGYAREQTQKEPENALDAFIHAAYGNPPPPKAANLDEAIRIAYEELLAHHVGRQEVASVAMELNRGPIPYSTYDLAVSIALNFFKQPERLQQLGAAQLTARLMVAQWTNEKKVIVPLAAAFEDALYKLYKP